MTGRVEQHPDVALRLVLRELGYEPVPIETAEGKAAYVAEQRGFAERGQALRARLVEALDAALGQLPETAGPPVASPVSAPSPASPSPSPSST